MAREFTFGAEPERLRRLLLEGLEEPEGQGDITCSLSDDATQSEGEWIGRYRLIRTLGEGGMGIVYLAEQKQPIRRQVALKVIKPGMDSKRIIARFENERQALALLDHPNIAHVYDADTTEIGRPYFVMEYVKGLPITGYCDRHKLTIEERLKLFQQVCDAIQHAHQKGIIHRDIKPSNIIVLAERDKAIPNIIDFGIAKAISAPLTERTLFTEDSQLLGTPEYMSPEQAEMANEDIDTRSDIYSLGVLLYELLTGVLPFDSATFREGGIDQVRQIIRETDPKTPSTRLTKLGEEAKKVAEDRRTEVAALAKRLHRELEWIPLKAMRKERSQRYRSASELADDIENYLTGAPLIAGPLTAGYRLQKFLHRNKGVLAAVAAVAAVLVLGVLVSTWQAISATQAKKAESRLRQQAQANEREMRETAYASDMNLAARALSANNLGRALYLLGRHRPPASHSDLADSNDLRGWEWRYLWQQCRSDALYEFCQRPGVITSLSISHDGRLLAIGEREGGGVSIWNLTARERLATFGSNERKARVAFSPQEPVLAFSTVPSVDPSAASRPDYDRCYVRLWDGRTRRIVGKVPLAGSCVNLKFSEDGRSLVIISQDIPGSGSEEMNRITVWSILEDKELASFSPVRSRIINTEPLAISSDNTFAVYVGRWQDRIRFIDLVTGDEDTTETSSSGTTALALSKDSRILASGIGFDDPEIRLWDVESRTEIRRLKGHRDWITDLQFSHDGETLISTSADQTIRVWDVSDPCDSKLRRTFRGHATEVWRIALLPDNRTLVSGGKDGSVLVWDIQKQPFEIGPVIRPHVRSFRFTPDTSDVLILDANGSVIRLHGPRFQEEHFIRSIDQEANFFKTLISPDNKLLAAPLKEGDTKKGGAIKVWDLQSGAVLPTIPYQQKTEPIAFLEQGTKLVTFERNGGSHDIWDLATGRHLQSWAGGAGLSPFVCPILSTDERLMLTLRYWKVPSVLRDMTTGNQTYANLDITETSGVSFSPDGELLAASSHLGFVKLWEVEDFCELETFKGFLLGVHSVAFSPDGQRLAAGSDFTEAVKLWDVDSLEELLTLPGQGPQHFRAAFSPDGDVLATLNSSGQLHLWRAPSWEEIEKAEVSLTQ